MAVTDLTNTTWVFNSTINIEEEQSYFIDFTSNGITYASINFESGKLGETMLYGNNTVYEGGEWEYEAEKTVAITGGTDATTSSLIQFFEANAVQQTVTTPDISITYEDTEIATMSESGTKTLKTSGKYCTDDITIVYTKQGGGGGGSHTVTIDLETPISPSSFVSCIIYDWTDDKKGEQLGTITSPTESVTMSLDASIGLIRMEMIGDYVAPQADLSSILCYGGVGVRDYGEGGVAYYTFVVNGDGQVTIWHIDWSD